MGLKYCIINYMKSDKKGVGIVMKKAVGFILLTVFFLLAVFPVGVYAKKGSSTSASSEKASEESFYVSIYNERDRSFPVTNQKFTMNGRIAVIDTLELLKEEEFIEAYTVSDNVLTSLKLKESEIVAPQTLPKAVGFYLKRNGVKQPAEAVNRLVENGDILEWIYGNIAEAPDTVVSAPPENTTDNNTTINNTPKTEYWTEDIQKILLDSCEYLTLNQENSSYYIIALGSAGRTGDIKMVNELLSEVRQASKDAQPADIAKNILALTFCGYDASELVATLSEYENINSKSIEGSISALLAFDSKQYAVPIDKINSRDKLITSIIAAQRESGGFGETISTADNVGITALAVTALSPYIEREDVKAVIDKAVQFLLNSQTKTGGFAIYEKESSTSLSQVIVAISSIGTSIDDKRFMNYQNNLLDLLLKYLNDDGGFSEVAGEASSAIATEHAILALCAIKQGDNPYKMSRTLTPLPQVKNEQTITDAVISENLNTILFGILTVIIVIAVICISVALRITEKKRVERIELERIEALAREEEERKLKEAKKVEKAKVKANKKKR